ncbi:MAG: hypothetical protein R3F07_18620 [Opitutaceae bacterium]
MKKREPEVRNHQNRKVVMFTAIGVAAGAALGAILGNVGLWVALGCSFGCALGFIAVKQSAPSAGK